MTSPYPSMIDKIIFIVNKVESAAYLLANAATSFKEGAEILSKDAK